MKLIDKDALVAEIERLKANALQKKEQCKRRGLEKIMHQIGAYNKVLSFIDTLEVKEVDFEKERLTWKDIGTIDQLLWDLSEEHSGKSDNEGYYKAVLSRFKAQKGE